MVVSHLTALKPGRYSYSSSRPWTVSQSGRHWQASGTSKEHPLQVSQAVSKSVGHSVSLLGTGKPQELARNILYKLVSQSVSQSFSQALAGLRN